MKKENIDIPPKNEGSGSAGPARRGRRIEVRVNDRELSRIRARARRRCMTVSAYMRLVALQAEGVPVVEIDTPLLRGVHANLKRAGSNVNQIARHLNAYGADSASVDAAESALGAISKAADAASSVLATACGQTPRADGDGGRK